VVRWNELGQVPADFGPAVVTIGNFDGVHRGHHAVLQTVVELAHSLGLKSVAITFEPHPVAFLYPQRAPAPLSTVEHKVELLGEIGIDAVLVQAFTTELAKMTPREYVEEVLVRVLHTQAVVVGGDMRFGYRNSGDIGTLGELGAELGFEVHIVADLGVADLGVSASPSQGRPDDWPGMPQRRWSSTWVRELVATGDVVTAAQVLGRPHRVTGEVVHGDHRGRELGYPTANLSTAAIGAIPADGVYAGWLTVLGTAGPRERWPAAISIGTNPTFQGTSRRVEAYVVDQTGLDLYGHTVALEFVDRLRPTLTFDGVDALVTQMKQDVDRCRDILEAG
jgi:riboflavin kinase / FMN adenylyltransferase